MKKISILLTASVFMFLSFSVSAEVVASGTNCGSNCSWSLDSDGNVNVTGTGTITSSPWSSSTYKDQVTSITTTGDINGNVSCIDCSGLTEVTLSKNVSSLSWHAFMGTGLTNIVIPEDSNLKTIGDAAFNGTNITSINIPNTVTTIGGGAFDGTKLTSLTVPDSVTSGVSCIDCSDLTEVTLGKNVSSLNWHAFMGTGLTSIVIPEDSKLTTIGESAFYGTKIESLVIPDSVTTIGGAAFYGVSLSGITCNEENLARYLATGGIFKDGATISCSRGNCENALKGTKWEGKVSVTYPTEVKPLANGGVDVFKNGEFVGYKGKRIYTVDEASAVSKDKNKLAIRYK